MLVDAELNLSAAFGAPITSPPADVLLRDRDVVAVGTIRLEVIHVPGHTPGGIALYSPVDPALAATAESKDPVLFSGDALFRGSIGRADFPGGSAAAAYRIHPHASADPSRRHHRQPRPRRKHHHRRGSAVKSVPRLIPTGNHAKDGRKVRK